MKENPVRILVVDNERPIRRFLNASLSGQYTVLEAASGQEALTASVSERPDLVILDPELPDIDGIEVMQLIREWTQIPIIVVSMREREGDKVAALDAGADDYLTKPFSLGELMARMRVALRHVSFPNKMTIYHTDQLVIDITCREVRVGGKLINLTPKEYNILRTLVQHVGKVLTHQQLIRYVWGNNSHIDPHLLRVNISNLRQKIEADPARPHFILTEPGVGYRLK